MLETAALPCFVDLGLLTVSLSTLFISDHKTSSDANLSDVRRTSEKTDLSFKTEILSETLEANKQSILVLPGRILCEVKFLDAKIFGITVNVVLFLLQSHSYYNSFENK